MNFILIACLVLAIAELAFLGWFDFVKSRHKLPRQQPSRLKPHVPAADSASVDAPITRKRVTGPAR